VRLSLSIASVTVIALVTPLIVGITSDALAVEKGSPSKTTGTLNPQPPHQRSRGFNHQRKLALALKRQMRPRVPDGSTVYRLRGRVLRYVAMDPQAAHLIWAGGVRVASAAARLW
jgi:hypothetical protein